MPKAVKSNAKKAATKTQAAVEKKCPVTGTPYSDVSVWNVIINGGCIGDVRGHGYEAGMKKAAEKYGSEFPKAFSEKLVTLEPSLSALMPEARPGATKPVVIDTIDAGGGLLVDIVDRVPMVAAVAAAKPAKTEPAKPAKVEPSKPAKPAKPTNGIEATVISSGPAKPAKKAEPAKPAKTEPAKKAEPSTGLRKPQVKILAALSKQKKPVTRKNVAALAGVDNAGCTEWIGSTDPAKRESNDKKHFPSLVTLGFVAEHKTDVDGKDSFAYSITEKGKAALKTAE